MAVKYAVLGLLVERRGYGYDLMQRLEERLGPAWQLNPSTVYAAIDQLEGDGMIERMRGSEEEEISPKRRGVRRTVYEATERGERGFAEWVRRSSGRQEPVRSELQLKVATARPPDVPPLLEAIDHAERTARRLCEEYREETLAGVDEPPSVPSPAALTRTAAVFRLEAELRWLQVARRALQSRSPSRPDGREGLHLRDAAG